MRKTERKKDRKKDRKKRKGKKRKKKKREKTEEKKRKTFGVTCWAEKVKDWMRPTGNLVSLQSKSVLKNFPWIEVQYGLKTYDYLAITYCN